MIRRSRRRLHIEEGVDAPLVEVHPLLLIFSLRSTLCVGEASGVVGSGLDLGVQLRDLLLELMVLGVDGLERISQTSLVLHPTVVQMVLLLENVVVVGERLDPGLHAALPCLEALDHGAIGSFSLGLAFSPCHSLLVHLSTPIRLSLQTVKFKLEIIPVHQGLQVLLLELVKLGGGGVKLQLHLRQHLRLVRPLG